MTFTMARGAQVNLNFSQANAGGLNVIIPGTPPAALPQEPAWWTLGKKIASFTVGAAVIAGTVIAYIVWKSAG